jgi:hypothetical protein
VKVLLADIFRVLCETTSAITMFHGKVQGLGGAEERRAFKNSRG